MSKKKAGGKSPKGVRPHPQCKALLLCDRTIREQGTNKVSLIGTFGDFVVPQFPGHTAPFTAYLQLIDGIGNYDVVVEVHDLQMDKVIARAEIPNLEFPVRLARIEVLIPVPPLPLQHAGSFDFVVFADGRELERQQFTAVEMKREEETNGD